MGCGAAEGGFIWEMSYFVLRASELLDLNLALSFMMIFIDFDVGNNFLEHFKLIRVDPIKLDTDLVLFVLIKCSRNSGIIILVVLGALLKLNLSLSYMMIFVDVYVGNNFLEHFKSIRGDPTKL